MIRGGLGSHIVSLVTGHRAWGDRRVIAWFWGRVVAPLFFDQWRGKSGHRRAGCRTSFTASAGGAFQGAPTESVTENIPPRGQPRGKGEKVG